MRKLRRLGQLIAVILGFAALMASAAYAIDSEVTLKTLTGIKGINVVVEEMQPNIQKYAQKFGLQKEQVKSDVESALRKADVSVLTYDEWLRTPGRPFLYIVINTHEFEKYWYAYDVRVQLRQSVFLDMNPSIRTMAGTWGVNMTGTANIGKLNVIKDSVNVLMGRFIEAYRRANAKDVGPRR